MLRELEKLEKYDYHRLCCFLSLMIRKKTGAITERKGESEA